MQDYFIFYKPKDIVSGDFYWFKKFFNYNVIVAADCTGHGVPGAFMSLLGISLLNEITYKHYRKIRRTGFAASKILDELKKHIIKLLGQKITKDSTRDGIDLAMCIIDEDTNKLQYAGAYNPLILFQNNEMTIIKADKMPVGIHFVDVKDKKFTNHTIQLQKNDVFYIFSDGYYDQFGGEKGRKFHRKTFRKLLTEIYKKPMNEQKNIIYNTITNYMENYKQTYKQTDDMLVVGVKI